MVVYSSPRTYLRVPNLLKTWRWPRRINPFHKETTPGGSGHSHSSPIIYLCIPDLLRTWRWTRKISPLHREVGEEGSAWLHSLKPFNPKSQYAFDKCDFELFAALMLPSAPQNHLRSGLDLLYLFFVIDEYTDVESGPVVRQMMDECLDALYNPHNPRPVGECVLAEMTRQFWKRALAIATPQGAKHFVACFADYLNSVVAEAEMRDRGDILTLDAYLAIRLLGVGVHPCYAIGELPFEFSDEFIYNADMMELTRIGCELVAIDNDILSYNREQASGVGSFNYVTVAMHNLGLDHNGAIHWLAGRSARLEEEYMDCMQRIMAAHAAGADDEPLREYLEHMGNVRRAVWSWSFESGRYFGKMGAQIAQTRMVPLIPPKLRSVKHVDEDRVDIMLMEEELARL